MVFLEIPVDLRPMDCEFVAFVVLVRARGRYLGTVAASVGSPPLTCCLLGFMLVLEVPCCMLILWGPLLAGPMELRPIEARALSPEEDTGPKVRRCILR